MFYRIPFINRVLFRVLGFAKATAGQELREEKSWGISGKPHDDDGFTALAQLESA